MTQAIDIKKLQISTSEKILLDISFKINNSIALIGQSGSGKSLTLKSILNLLPSNLKKTFEVNSKFELNSSNIGFIPQNPFTSLSPMTKIKDQFFCKEEKKKKLLLLDEPTTALDEKSKKLILDLIYKLQKELNILTLFISHDINSIKNISEDIVIIKDGKVVEKGKTLEVLTNSKAAYTKQLINSTFENKEFRK